MDEGYSYEIWREKWIRDGMKWMHLSYKPLDWNPVEQLRRFGVVVPANVESLPKIDLIYVRILFQGNLEESCTPAEILGDGLFRVLPSVNLDFEPDTKWEFPAGTVVRCKQVEIMGNKEWLAVEKVE